MEILQNALSSLTESFNAFQTQQEKRWDDIYSRSWSDLPLETKGADAGFVSFLRTGAYEKKALTEEGSGRYAVPSVVVSQVGHYLNPRSPLRTLCSASTVGSDRLEILVDQGNADAGWVKETEDREETKTPELAKITIPLHEMYAKPRVSQRMCDDALIDLQAWITKAVADQMARLETMAFLFGDGQTQPKGLLTYPTEDLGKESTGTFGCFKVKEKDLSQGLLETFYALSPDYAHDAVWVMNRASLMAIQRLQDKTGRGLWQPNLQERGPSLLLGYPVVTVDAVPSLGSKGGVILFGNFKSTYHIVDHSNVTMMRDPFSAKPYVEFYTTRRVGGDVVRFDTMKMLELVE